MLKLETLNVKERIIITFGSKKTSDFEIIKELAKIDIRGSSCHVSSYKELLEDNYITLVEKSDFIKTLFF